MLKNLFTFVLLFIILNSALSQELVTDKISKYAGENSADLIKILRKAEQNPHNDSLQYAKFIIENSSPNDLAVLDDSFIFANIEMALKTRQLSYARLYPEKIFKHFVLPNRITQEPYQNWRANFYSDLKNKVKNIKKIEKAAILVNLWALEQLSYKSTHGRDQAPLTSIKRGYGRCEEMMILYIAAARSVGIPCRPASVPYWNFTDSNHAWVEVWTPTGWKYLGEAANSLNKTWFTKTTKRAMIVTSEAFGNYNSPNTLKQKNNVTYLNSINYYTESEKCIVKVLDINSQPVENANITLYGVSFGGLFDMISFKTDKNGSLSLDLGKGSVFITAFKKNQIGYGLLNTMNDNKIDITLKDNYEIDLNFDLLFPLPAVNSEITEQDSFFPNTFALRRENSNLKRKNRLLEQQQVNYFVKYYDLAQDSTEIDFEKREEFLEKCNSLAANTSEFLKVFKAVQNNKLKIKILTAIIQSWDTKELVEIPDSSEIHDKVDILFKGKKRYEKIVPDSIFYNYVVEQTWHSATPPENGWHKVFYQKLEPFIEPTINKTAQNILKWIDKKITVEENFKWSFFSGSLNPVQLLNMKYMPSFYRIKVINSAFKEAGIPVRWKGLLEYFDGKNFIPIETKEKEKTLADSCRIKIFADDKQIKAEPWNNFLIASLNKKNGIIKYTFFEGYNDSLDYIANYRHKKNEPVYLEAFIRNTNGDANVKIKSLENHAITEVFLKTPQEFIDYTNRWSPQELTDIKQISTQQNKKIIFIRGPRKIEPEISMLNQLYQKVSDFNKHNTDLIIYSENRSNQDISNNYSGIELKSGKKILTNLQTEDYPAIFLLNEKNKIIFSTNGFNLGIAELIMKKIK